jgi:hypothetical protein
MFIGDTETIIINIWIPNPSNAGKNPLIRFCKLMPFFIKYAQPNARGIYNPVCPINTPASG